MRAAVQALSAARVDLMLDPEVLLIDTSPGVEHSLKQALAAFGLPMPDEGLDFFRQTQLPLPQLFAKLLSTDEREHILQFFNCFNEYFDKTGRYMGRLRAGSTRFLANIAASGRFDCHYLSHIGKHASAQLLDAYGIGHFFRSTIATERQTCPRTRLGLMRDAVRTRRTPDRQWLLLSDHPWELMTAETLGIRAIALGYGRSPLRVLSTCPAEAIAASVGDVEAHLLDPAEHGNVLRLQPRRTQVH